MSRSNAKGSAIFVLLAGFAVTATAQPAAEVERVRAHLVAARSYVESDDTSALAPLQKAHRATALAVLDRYIAGGVFPVRGDDGYGPLQPRFIDARGVHCAVGQMIAQTGHEDLARAINEQFEYAKVVDIDSPALLAWAADYGFSVDELARIQPSYSAPPTEDSVRRDIERERDNAMLACAIETPPARVKLRVIVAKSGGVTYTAPEYASPFETCFAAALHPQLYGGAMNPSPTPFDREMSFSLRTPDEVLESRLTKDIGFQPQCSPRPGALARSATMSITSSVEDGLKVSVTTKPANAQTATCIKDNISSHLEEFDRVGTLSYSHTWELPRMTSSAVKAAVASTAPGFATDCYVKETAHAKLTFLITAKADDPTFTISTDASPDDAQCIAKKLQASLRARLTVGTYFRIDNAIETEVTFPVEIPADRTARVAREREEQNKRAIAQRKKLEEELRRHRYD